MKNNCVVIAHVPLTFGHPMVFVANLLRFAHRYPIILFTARDDIPQSAGVTVIRIKDVGEQLPGAHNVTNTIWLTALRIAFVHNAYTHMLYLEEDCRVGCDYWDEVVFNEFFANAQFEDSIGGTPMCFGERGLNQIAQRQWQELLAQNIRKNFPVPTYGAGRSAHNPIETTCITVCGALGIYPRELMLKLFDLRNTMQLAGTIGVWDFELGRRMWNLWKVEAFKHVVYLKTVLSSFDLSLSTEDERIAMLTTGLTIDEQTFKVVAIHKIKSAWPGPELSAPPVETKSAAPASDIRPVLVEMHKIVETAGKLLDIGMKPEDIRITKLRTDILIVVTDAQVEWLAYCLQSIAMFFTGYGNAVVVAPASDSLAKDMVMSSKREFKFAYFHYQPAPHPKEQLDHALQQSLADLHCPDSDLVLIIEPTCIFTKPTTPDDFMHEGRPVLLVEPYAALTKQKARHAAQDIVRTTLKHPVDMETRHLPVMHWRETFAWARVFVETRQGLKFKPYVLAQRPDEPLGFQVLNTLGAFALLDKRLRDRYQVIDITHEPRPDQHVVQFWNGSLDERQAAPVHGLPAGTYVDQEDQTVVPRTTIEFILNPTVY